MKEKIKRLALPIIIIAIVFGYFSINSQSENEKAYKEAEKQLMELLIAINASTTSGVTSEEFKELTKDLSIKVNTIKIYKKITSAEESTLGEIVDQMGSAMHAWRVQEKCGYSIKNEKCLNDVSYILYNSGYNISNPNYQNANNDLRFNLNSVNSQYKEYKNVLINDAKDGQSDPYSDAISFFLSKTSQKIQSYFLLKGIVID
jgi:hypothetical protein